MAKKVKKTKKAARKGRNRAAQDITLINLRAIKHRVTALERAMSDVINVQYRHAEKLIELIRDRK